LCRLECIFDSLLQMNKEIKYVQLFFIQFTIVITIIIGISLGINIKKELDTNTEFAVVEARASYNKDLLYRRWAATHGGVYVPITDSTPPSPYLSFIPDRDITTTTGKRLTLINPAYMTRQVHQMADLQYGVKGHITSLKPIRPGNKPDEWESKVLRMFEQGIEEYTSLETINGVEYTRFMHAMKVEKSCLKCHSVQGYKLGEVRGGISVSVPMDVYNSISNEKIRSLVFTHIIILLFIVAFSFFSYKRLKKEMLKRDTMQKLVSESEDFLRQQNSEYAALNEEYKSQNVELHRAKENLEESARQLANAQKTANTGNWIWYIQENRLWWSDEMYRIFDISKETFSGNLADVIQEAIHPDDRLAVEESNRSVVKENKPIPVEYRINTKTGHSKYVLGLADEMILDDEGKSLQLTGIVKDITEYKLIQKELAEAKNKAEESDRLKSAFLQNMSHEIRTPLNAICGFASILGNPDLQDEKRDMFISIIHNASNQLLNIVTDVLTISSLETHQEKINKSNFEIAPILEEMRSNFESLCTSKGLQFIISTPVSKMANYLNTDRNKVAQIFNCLISNAVKFTHKGAVEIGYAFKYIEDKKIIEFFVKDTGIGIAEKYRELIFERFVQGDPNTSRFYGGTGLGLTIAKAFTEMLGGSIRLESETQKGSIFYFSLPHQFNTDVTLPKHKKIKNGDTITILVADDELYNFQYFEEIVREMNIKLLHAKNGEECVEMSYKNHDLSLILMDIKMPIMDGFEATAKVRKILPEVPIVAQTAYILENERNIYQTVFDDYLIKPINIKDFSKMLNKFIEFES